MPWATSRINVVLTEAFTVFQLLSERFSPSGTPKPDDLRLCKDWSVCQCFSPFQVTRP